MSTGKKLAAAFSFRLGGFSATMDGPKRNDGPVLRGYHAPGGKPGSYHDCKTRPNGNGRTKGTPSATMARLRALAKAKGGEHGHAGFR
jgi:hypothetical protein